MMRQKKDTRPNRCVNPSIPKTAYKNKHFNYNRKAVKKQYKIDLFKLIVIINFFVCSGLLVHDFIFWGIIPMFKGEFYQMTYLGLFMDLSAVFLLDLSIQLIKEWL